MEALLLNTDRLDLLRLFVRIAESGKISNAGDSLGLSQPSVSRLLKRLETILDTQLVTRSSSGVSLTPSGQELLVSARQLLRQWEQVVESAKPQKRSMAGHIRIAAPIAVGQNLLATMISAFLKKHPAITVEWELRDDQIDRNAVEYDLWIRAGEIRTEQLIVRELLQVHRAIVCAPNFDAPEHPSDLEATGAVRLSTFVPRSVCLTDEHGATYVLKQRCVLTTNNLYAALVAAREGLGYAVLPLWAAQFDLNRGVLVKACESWRPEPVVLSLAYPPYRNRPARVTALIKFLEAETTDDVGINRAFFDELEASQTVSVMKSRAKSASDFETKNG